MNELIVGMPAATYHADAVANLATLSSSVARILIDESPLHAWTAHPKLNPDHTRKVSTAFDLGTAVHEVFLEGQSAVELVEADDYRTKAAREQRDDIRTRGKIPMLAKHWPPVIDTVTAIRKRILDHEADPPLFQRGRAEVTAVWEDPLTGVACRARLDWLRDDSIAVDDLKTTSRSANPRSWARSMFGMGYDVQAEFYSRAVAAIAGVEPDFRFVVAEIEPPHAISVLSLAPDAKTIARKKVDYALELWARCLDRGVWPAYSTRVAFASLPAWEEAAWLSRELEEAEAAA